MKCHLTLILKLRDFFGIGYGINESLKSQNSHKLQGGYHKIHICTQSCSIKHLCFELVYKKTATANFRHIRVGT